MAIGIADARDASRVSEGAGTMVDMTRAALTDARRSPWVGRGEELSALQDALSTVRASSSPRVVVIGGEAGIGKSRLVAEWAGDLAEDVRVVVGHCLELGPDGPPFAPFAAVLRGLAAELGPEQVAELAGPGRVDLAVLAPELGGRQRDEQLGRGRLFEAVTTLIERVAAECPLILVVEDLHWSDTSTRDLLRFLMRTVDDVPLLLVLTYRRDELVRTHPLRPWLVEVDRLPHASRITLDPLIDSEVESLIAALGGSTAARSMSRIRQRSQGIPFFVEELTACAHDGGSVIPETLRELMLTRLDRLAPPSRDVVRLASASGTRIDHGVLLAMVDNDDSALDQALRDAVGAQVLVVDAAQEGYTFRHALMREAVHDDLLPGEHARLHARYARALEKLARPEQAGEIAHHWTSAHEIDRAFEWSLRAADLARARYAWQEQLTHLERALDLWDQVDTPEERAGFDRVELLARTGRSAMNLGLIDRGAALFDLAVEQLEQGDDPERLAHLLVTRARFCWERQADPSDDLDRAMTLAVAGSRDRAAALGARAIYLWLGGHVRDALEVAEQALVAAEECGETRQLSNVHNTLGCLLVQLGRLAEGQQHLERSLELATRSDSIGDLVRYYGNYSDALIGLGRFAEADPGSHGSAGSSRARPVPDRGRVPRWERGRGGGARRRVGRRARHGGQRPGHGSPDDLARTPPCAPGPGARPTGPLGRSGGGSRSGGRAVGRHDRAAPARAAAGDRPRRAGAQPRRTGGGHRRPARRGGHLRGGPLEWRLAVRLGMGPGADGVAGVRSRSPRQAAEPAEAARSDARLAADHVAARRLARTHRRADADPARGSPRCPS